MNEALSRLGAVSRDYEVQASEARDVYRAAAEADAAYKKGYAKACLRFKESVERMTVAEAQLRADADDAVADLYKRKVTAAADAEGLKAKLAQLKEQNANGRTAVVDERSVDQFHARGDGGTP